MDINKVEEQWPFLTQMHPAHLEYIKKLPLNTLEYFIKTLAKLEPKKRHKIVSIAAYMLFVPFVAEDDPMTILQDEENLFMEFGVKCLKTTKVFNEVLFVMAMVQYVLYLLSRMGDKTNIDTAKDSIIEFVEYMQQTPTEGHTQEERDEFIGKMVDHATNIPEQTDEYHNLYIYFCENVVQKLLEQKLT